MPWLLQPRPRLLRPEWTHLDRPDPGHRMLRGHLDRLLQVRALDQVEAEDLLLGLRDRPELATELPDPSTVHFGHPGHAVRLDDLVRRRTVVRLLVAADQQQVLHVSSSVNFGRTRTTIGAAADRPRRQ